MESPGGKSLSLDGGSSSSSRRDYEVFLSFRGPDTRLTITDSLYAAMIRAGIHVFKDDEELRVGEEIGGELLRAISNSKIYVPIFSKDYASSKWCLRELAHMVEHRKRDEKVILPIFYEVDASNVKLKTGSYSKALRKHERQSGEDAVKQWEEALREVAGIKGWNLKDHGQRSFERDSPPNDYIDIASEIVRKSGGLPLALEVIGSLLHLKSKMTWKDTLKKLKEVPNQDVQKTLLISYEELEHEQQQIFLDIACHCIGEERIPTYYMWKACNFFPKTGLHALIHLSLIKVIEDDRLGMHDQLRDLGREIVRKEDRQDPGKRSRLWCPTVGLDVLQNNLGTNNIVALKLTRLADGHNLTSGEF